MTRYGWIITRDHLADAERDEAGTMGPRDILPAHASDLRAGYGLTFRMLDDDGEVYYTGKIVGLGRTTEGLTEDAFAPLDDFGAPNAGCTTIQYRDPRGRWVTI